MIKYDSYTYSFTDILHILICAFGLNLMMPAFGLTLVISLADVLGIVSIPNVIDRLIYGAIIGYICCLLMLFSKANKRKAYYHPNLVAEREASYIAECERYRQEEARESAAFPIRMLKAREMVIIYGKLPTASSDKIQNAMREIESCKNYREINAWDYGPLSREISKAIQLNKNPPHVDVSSPSNDDFYKSGSWRRVRADALHRWGDDPCCCCNKSLKGQPKHVDHIKPRSRYPELTLKISNLQVMCEDCNIGKGNRHEKDWRTDDQKNRMGAVQEIV